MSINLGIIASSRSSAPSASLLLDTYPGAAAAYSLRKLRTAYTGAAIRVRRSSDNTETDIGFNGGGGLDTTALTTFVGAGNGFVIIWYDQSGNGRNATQVGQPKIISSSVLYTINSKAAINFDTEYFDVPAFSLVSDVSYFMVQKRKFGSQQGLNIGNSNGFGALFSQWNDGNIYFQRVTNSGGFYVGSSDTSTNYQLLEAYSVSTAMTMYKNAVQYPNTLSGTFSNTTTTFNNIGRSSGYNSQALGQEIIVYTSNQTSNRTGIESNINSFYTIY